MKTDKMDKKQSLSKHAELTELVIGVFMRFITSWGVDFLNRFIERQCDLHLRSRA